ncbi:MAG: shikimate kinase [Phycisphaerae bacterium]|jgi:shikimate kinase
MTSEERQRKQRTVALIGLRGSGKSVVGRELAALLGGDLVETDELIAARAGKSIARIFTEEGETAFRDLESEVIADIVTIPPTVVSVGGGAVLDQRNVQRLKAVATVVWLTAPVDALWQRVSADPTTARTRPPLTDEKSGSAEMRQLHAQRAALYEQAADLTIDTTGRQPAQIAQAIADMLPVD